MRATASLCAQIPFRYFREKRYPNGLINTVGLTERGPQEFVNLPMLEEVQG